MEALDRALRDHVAERKRGDTVESRLCERDHAAVRRQKDEAGGRDADQEGLRQDEADPVADPEDRKHGQEEKEGHTDEQLGQLLLRRGPEPPREGAHAGLPNNPCGLNASTSARSTNVSTGEYWPQQSPPVVGRYEIEKL